MQLRPNIQKKKINCLCEKTDDLGVRVQVVGTTVVVSMAVSLQFYEGFFETQICLYALIKKRDWIFFFNLFQFESTSDCSEKAIIEEKRKKKRFQILWHLVQNVCFVLFAQFQFHTFFYRSSLLADENADEVYIQELPVWKREYF